MSNTFDNSETKYYGERLPELAEGLILHEKYKLEDVIGQGRMGVVWKAKEVLVSGQEPEYVAIKFMRPDFVGSSIERNRVIEAYRKVRFLNHDHICKPTNLENARQHGYYIVMPFLAGKALDKYVESYGNLLPFQCAIDILMQIADALDTAHKFIIHRDIKPGNIFIVDSNDKQINAQLIDFGLVVRSGENNRESMGNPACRAPECWVFQTLTSAADQYGLACVAYKLLSGHFPHEADSHDELRAKVLHHTPEQLISIPGVTNLMAINNALQRALAKEPQDRFPSCSQFIAELNGIRTSSDLNSITLPPTTSHNDLRTISQDIDDLIPKLKQALLSHSLNSAANLFVSNADSQKISITVSSIILCALHTTEDPEAEVVREAIVKTRIQDKSNPNYGAWCGKDGYCHIMDTVWAIIACLQSKPSLVNDLQESINWLIKVQNHSNGGWGFVPAQPVRAFYSALATNALIEAYNAHKQVCQENEFRTTMRGSIDKGVEFLRKSWGKYRTKSDVDIYLWKLYHQQKGSNCCIASTAMSIHALAKYDKLSENAKEAKKFQGTLKELCKFLEGRISSEAEAPIPCQNEELRLRYWPEFLEKAPNYWYKYFTPILITTLLNTAKDLEWNDAPAATENAIINSVKWIIGNIATLDDETFVQVADIHPKSLWPSAQSIIVLHRWQEAYSQILFNHIQDARK